MADQQELGLYQRIRPKKFSDMKGQEEAVATLTKMLEHSIVPRALLFTGHSGSGKTTAGRILAKRLGCNMNKANFKEINCASERGIDDIRKIISRLYASPLGGKCRVWLLDEFHRTTGDGMSAMLKALEDTPKHVYFILATTDPQKIIKPIITRCTEVQFKPIADKIIETLIRETLEKETGEVCFSDETINLIVDSSESSARKALVLVEQVLHLPDAERQSVIQPPEMKRQAWDLVKSLLYEKPNWPKVATLIKEVDLSEPEKFRRLVLACANTELLKANKNSERAARIIDSFEGNWFDVGAAGLSVACHRIAAG
jgi:replication-associated recombination protein RarA